MLRKDLFRLCCTVSILFAATPALAANQSLLNVLLNNGTITCKQYRTLSKSYGRVGRAKQCAKAGQRAPKKKTTKSTSYPAKAKVPGIHLESADKNFTADLGLQIQADAAFYDQDKTPLGNGQELRRARPYIKGKLSSDWAYEIEFGFGGNSASLYHAYLQYNGFSSLKHLNIKLGDMKQPFSLEQRNSDTFITFMERALPSAFVPIYRIGIKAGAHGSDWTAAAGTFGQSVGANSDEDERNSGINGVARATFAPIHDRRHLFHIGASFDYRFPGGGESVRYRSRPESHVTSVRLVDTGSITHVDHFDSYGGEIAGAWGPVEAQGEYIRTHIERKGLAALNVNGWYAQASGFLTGESRAAFYSTSSGTFGRVIPEHSFGAVELAVRYSALNLNDRDIRGGNEHDITAAINWYPNAWLRLSANYISVVSKRAGLYDDPNVFQLRGQVSF